MAYTFIDLFAGCGGLSEGFVRAGFVPIAHVEMDKDACNTLKTRSCFHYLEKSGQLDIYEAYLKGDISREVLYSSVPEEVINTIINSEIANETIEDIFNKINRLAGDHEIDMIIGGPPCQAYSLLGRHRKEMEDDPRTLLYRQYGKFLNKFKPKGFVFENVPGLISAKKGQHFQNLQDYFDELGYTVHYKMLNSSDFGVLQTRHRIILVGWRKDADLGYPTFKPQKAKAVVNDLLVDLPELKAGEVVKVASYRAECNDYLKDSDIRSEKDRFVCQNITRSLNANDAMIYAFAIQRWNEKRIRVKYTDLPIEYRTQKNESSFLDRFKVVDGKGFSHTVVAHLAKDGHYYIHPSFDSCRSISVREAARLQSFPDNFYFEGGRSAMFKQIGNAVPVLMANCIALEIIKMLSNNE